MNAYLANLSDRERRLLGIAGVLVGCIVVYLIVSPAMNFLNDLDETIADREFQLKQYTEHAARAEDVDTAYAKIAREHGSDMTQQAIHDSLRAELLRLAARDMPAPGQGVVAANANQRLVSFRDLPEGTLTAGLEGYREYTIEVRTITGSLSDHIEFLKRIQQSPIALRVKRLELLRQHNAKNQATAVIELARVVVDGVPLDGIADVAAVEKATMVNGGFELYDEAIATFPGWIVEGATMDREIGYESEGGYCVRVTAESGNATLYQELTIAGGSTYECSIDLASMNETLIRVADEAGVFLGEPMHTVPEGALTRYTFRFTAPGESRDPVSIRMPVIQFTEAGHGAYIDNVKLRYVEDGE